MVFASMSNHNLLSRTFVRIAFLKQKKQLQFFILNFLKHGFVWFINTSLELVPLAEHLKDQCEIMSYH